jgi:hypothetical protein
MSLAGRDIATAARAGSTWIVIATLLSVIGPEGDPGSIVWRGQCSVNMPKIPISARERGRG